VNLGKLTFCFALITIFFSTAGCNCKYTHPQNDSLKLNDTVTVALHDTLHNSKEHICISFDSLENDSRCPSGSNCIWAGEARIKITFSNAGDKKSFVLSTLTTQDTTISHYKIRLVDVTPYPNGSKINPENYKMRVFVSK
jgi:hypothetical protein